MLTSSARISSLVLKTGALDHSISKRRDFTIFIQIVLNMPRSQIEARFFFLEVVKIRCYLKNKTITSQKKTFYFWLSCFEWKDRQGPEVSDVRIGLCFIELSAMIDRRELDYQQFVSSDL